ncbi:hypothetical protein FYK55_09080 [Roseiconus nitratireducens]|uniref:Uncharacterized protein n=1 Tax=Roseiconus nitratireducens TaxID=2605748 RepID=A0A5M6DAS3_9BACT|nr:hypothetical protein [Roseiconus nitratireducens]KAA5544473.1 hypothetical protein FYK55_09080 [Roseiconus nitratireducens]
MKCDEGYRCEVCGNDVTSIVESDLYLRFVIGELDAEVLHTTPERHLRCNPVLAQFIEDDRFPPVQVQGPMARQHLDTAFVATRCKLVSRGYRRLREIAEWPGDRDLTTYPLPEVVARHASG